MAEAEESSFQWREPAAAGSAGGQRGEAYQGVDPASWKESSGWDDELPGHLRSHHLPEEKEAPTILENMQTGLSSDGPAAWRTKSRSRNTRGHASLQKQVASLCRSWYGIVLNLIRNRMTFYQLHLLYFILVDLIGTLVIWLSPPTSLGQISFIDALYCATSALTVTGLVSVKMATFSIFNQIVLMLLMLLGGGVFTSLLPVLIRRYFFRERIKIAKMKKEEEEQHYLIDAVPERARASSLSRPALANQGGGGEHSLKPIRENQLMSNSDLTSLNVERNATTADTTTSRSTERDGDGEEIHPHAVLGSSPHGSTDHVLESEASPLRSRTDITKAADALKTAHEEFASPRFDPGFLHAHTWSGATARSQGELLKRTLDVLRERRTRSSSGSPDDERIEGADSLIGSFRMNCEIPMAREEGAADVSTLRTQEYRALQTLSWLVPAYLFVTQGLAFIVMLLNFAAAPGQRRILSDGDVNFAFFSGFQVVSAFQNAGYGLLDTSMVSFQRAILLIVVLGTLILLGNTLYAPTMRGILYLLARWTKAQEDDKYGFQYLLDHPRRCFTHLFPWHQTLWLLVTVILFNAVELLFFCILDWNVPALAELSGGYKFLDGLFQAINTRSSGFAIVPIGALSPSMLVLYCGMMYIAVYPVYLSRQTSRPGAEVVINTAGSLGSSNYDGRDVGIYTDDLPLQDQSLLTQGRLLLFRDSMILFLSVFLITVIQSDEVKNDPNFEIFYIIFEVISAYGNVGLSVGYTCVPESPDATCESPPYSFSGVWKTPAKLMLVFVMLLGRHRGLPDNIDAAVRIPSQEMFRNGAVAQRVEDPEELRLMSVVNRAQRRLDRAPSIFRTISNRLGGQASMRFFPASPSAPALLRRATSAPGTQRSPPVMPRSTTLPNAAT